MVQKNHSELDRTEEVIREMDRLANEDHTDIAMVIGGYVRILLVPTRCP